jgi:hypothetical protein
VWTEQKDVIDREIEVIFCVYLSRAVTDSCTLYSGEL